MLSVKNKKYNFSEKMILNNEVFKIINNLKSIKEKSIIIENLGLGIIILYFNEFYNISKLIIFLLEVYKVSFSWYYIS